MIAVAARCARRSSTATAWLRARPGHQDQRYAVQQRRARLDPQAQRLTYAISEQVVELPEESFDWGVEALIAGIAARLGL